VKTLSTKSQLTAFLYQLMRDHVTPGVIEGLVLQDESAKVQGHDTFVLTNGHLAAYAEEVAKRLTG
jgi:hypothetical protein